MRCSISQFALRWASSASERERSRSRKAAVSLVACAVGFSQLLERPLDRLPGSVLAGHGLLAVGDQAITIVAASQDPLGAAGGDLPQLPPVPNRTRPERVHATL